MIHLLKPHFDRLIKLCSVLIFAQIVFGTAQPAKALDFTDPIFDWKWFSSYPYLSKASRALSEQRYTDAERDARFVLRIQPDSRQAKLILAEALLAQERYGEALDALHPNSHEPLYQQIQLSWLNDSKSVPESRVDQWLTQDHSGDHATTLIQARAEQLRLLRGPEVAWLWLRDRGGDVAYRSGLAELAQDWKAVVEELTTLEESGSEMLPVLLERLTLARDTLNPPDLPPPTLDELSYRLIEAGRLKEALELLETELLLNHSVGSLIPSKLAKRLINLYSQVEPPEAIVLTSLAPLLPPNERGVLFELLASRGECNLLPDFNSRSAEIASAGEWYAYGLCSIRARPGEASVYFEQAIVLGRHDAQNMLAFSLASAGEPRRAYEIWENLPFIEQDQSEVQAGMAQVSLELNQLAKAKEHWKRITDLGVDEWRLGALIAAACGDLDSAYERFGIFLSSESSDASDFYQAGLIARDLDNLIEARDLLKRANELDPNNFRYLSDYGFTLSQDSDSQIRDQALTPLLRASQISDGNAVLEAEIAKLFKRRSEIKLSLKHYKRAIELEQDPASSTEHLGLASQRQRLYGLKRNYELLSRRNYWLIDLTTSPYGQSVEGLLIDDLIPESKQIVTASSSYEHTLKFQKLFTYVRSIGIYDLARSESQLSSGLGLRYKPYKDLNLNLYAEYWQGRVGDLLSDDVLLRFNGSIFDQGDWNGEWKEDRVVWNERSLYFDTAYFMEQSQLIGLYRYSQGRTWKLSSKPAQTISPYLLSQIGFQNTKYDIRVGVGLRWQFWLQEDELRAYRRRLTIRVEFQQPLSTDLYQNTPGGLLSLTLNL